MSLPWTAIKKPVVEWTTCVYSDDGELVAEFFGKNHADNAASTVLLIEALELLLSACEAHNEANGRQMIDPHAESEARETLEGMNK